MLKIVVKEISYVPPQEIFNKIKNLAYPFLLESALNCNANRFSYAGCLPFEIITQPITAGKEEVLKTFNELNSRYLLPLQDKPVPFIGGAVGFISYDFGRCLENIPETTLDDLSLPYYHFAYYAWIFAWDHLLKKSYIIATGFPNHEKVTYYKTAQKNISFALSLLEKSVINIDHTTYKKDLYKLHLPYSRQDYEDIIKKTIQYICAGDIFQANISQRFIVSPAPPSWESYRAVTKINAAPFAAYLVYPEFEIVCASPERFIKKTGNIIETSPIKGTRKRGLTPKQDEELRQELWTSHKDRAELAMIIDLQRNDLNKFCLAGSVHVPELYTIEAFPSVWHLISKIQGTLPNDISISKIISEVFPGGSITGAPKIRAMEIIEELEKVRRGIYTGSIGYIGFDEDFDFNIVIRTALFKNQKVYIQTGGGITALSDPGFEYEETLIKAEKLFNALGVSNYEINDK